MALPKLETAKYSVEIPSTKQTIEFRPFLVKEEKILIQAQESGDTNQIIKALKDIIRVCTFEKVKPNDLTLFDLSTSSFNYARVLWVKKSTLRSNAVSVIAKTL